MEGMIMKFDDAMDLDTWLREQLGTDYNVSMKEYGGEWTVEIK